MITRISHEHFNMSRDDLVVLSDINIMIDNIYKAIPSHHVVDLSPDDKKYLLGYYPELYAKLSELFSFTLLHYDSRSNDGWKKQKFVLDQALKVVRFQYEGLSRKISDEKDQHMGWQHNT